ncbi:conserved hypothetical protein [Culex quinquefasciatus]|uniref:Uncharacterized protein n=1 Tax=Culex quinquefasciatus TaxID=7176 RepID=B0XLB4_CULQU|nr:conserved hypothetical protein [Culex quinquefasciatus]|eukprot:XP_001870436.1 conserved hypothetical protein [Culex quinquefasciatus]
MCFGFTRGSTNVKSPSAVAAVPHLHICRRSSSGSSRDMLDLQRHIDCPLWEVLGSPAIPWSGMRYACVKVLHAYCKVFDQQELYDLIVR